jgi:hypothetical protein
VNKFYADAAPNTKMPRVHPIIQLMADEWDKSRKENCAPKWDGLSIAYITQICQNVAADHPEWHRDLVTLDLSAYLRGLTQRKRWWVQETEDGTWQHHIHSEH